MWRPWWDLAFIELGLYCSGFMLMMGGLIAGSGWPWYDILAWFILGNLILLVFYVLIGNVGVKERVPLSFIAEKIFGKIGAKLFNLLLLVGILAWAALGMHQLALAITYFTGIDPYITAVIAALFVWLSSVAGYKSISLLSKIAIPWFAVLLTIAMIYYGFQLGWNAWGVKTSYGGFYPSFWSGVTFVVWLNIMASFLSPNTSRYAKSIKDYSKAVTLAIFHGMVVMSFLSATLAAYALEPTAPFADPTVIGVRTLGVAGAFLVPLLIWTTADNDFWYLSLALPQVYPKIPRWVYNTILVFGSLIIIYAGVLYRYVDFASTLAVIWSSIPGMLIAHYYVLPRLGVEVDVLAARKVSINVIAFVSWIIGTVVAYFASSQQLPFPELQAAFVALLSYALMMLIYRTRK